MVKQFLKIAGVRTEQEFLKKYPTEAAFFRDHPEAEMLKNAHAQMAYGGMYHYGPGGPILPGTLNTAINQTVLDQSAAHGTPPLLARPADPMVGPVIPPQYAQAAQAAPSYQGVSIVDMLNTAGLPSDKASRKAMAESKGIKNYTGSATQNRQLIELMGGKFTGGAGSPTGGGKKASSKSTLTDQDYADYNNEQAIANPYVMAPTNPSPYGTFPRSQGTGVGNDQPVQDENGNWVWPTLGVAGGAGLGYGAYKATKAELNAVKGFGDLYKGKSAKDIVGIIKSRGFRLPGDAEQLAKAGMKPAEAMSELKGIKFMQGATKDALAGVQQAKVFQGTADALEKARPIAETYVNRFKNAKPIIAKIKSAGVRTAEDVEALRKAGLTSKETMEALKGIPMSKIAATVKNSGTWGDAFKAGTMALREAPLFKFLRRAPKEYGGQMAYGGMYDDGGMYAYGGVSGQNPHPGVYEDGYSGTNSGPNYFPYGGSFMPQPMMMPGQLPEYGYGRAMYGAGMAYGGFYDDSRGLVNRGPYQGRALVNRFADGGSYTKGSVHDMDEDQVQELVNQGYKIEYI
jgi:hypothetical protein